MLLVSSDARHSRSFVHGFMAFYGRESLSLETRDACFVDLTSEENSERDSKHMQHTAVDPEHSNDLAYDTSASRQD